MRRSLDLDSSRPPAITVKSYLEDRILKYAGCSEETFILALIYMDQVVQFNPEFVISSLNVHRLLITAIMLASLAALEDDATLRVVAELYAPVGELTLGLAGGEPVALPPRVVGVLDRQCSAPRCWRATCRRPK